MSKIALNYTKKINDAKGAEAFASLFLRFFIAERAVVSVFDGLAFASVGVSDVL